MLQHQVRLSRQTTRQFLNQLLFDPKVFHRTYSWHPLDTPEMAHKQSDKAAEESSQALEEANRFIQEDDPKEEDEMKRHHARADELIKKHERLVNRLKLSARVDDAAPHCKALWELKMKKERYVYCPSSLSSDSSADASMQTTY